MGSIWKAAEYFCSRRGREDVYNRRPGYCVWCISISCLWFHLLDNNIILTKRLDRVVKPFCYGEISSIMPAMSLTEQMLKAYFLPFLLLSQR